MTAPRRVGVVGAGVVGLSTAWFLQECGVEVTVLDRTGPGAGASWGNAGWITPTLSTPLPEPSMLAHGLRQLFRPSSPLYVPLAADVDLTRFLIRFARNSTRGRWQAGMRKLVGINRLALDAFDALVDGGVDAVVREADPFVVGYTDPDAPQALLAEGRELAATGQPVTIEPLTVAQARETAPILSENIRAALHLGGQRYLDPPAFVAALAESVAERGGLVKGGAEIAAVRDRADRVAVVGDGFDEEFDAVVLANGATLTSLAAAFGVRAQVRAGRGYSFAVPADPMPSGPLYFPSGSVVCTPLGGHLRIAGMMEFRPHDAPLDPRRIEAVVASVRPYLRDVDLDDRRDEWVGSRPCTADGLPLIGRTMSPRVFVAGGHGMEGMTLGPATGRLLAQEICTGAVPYELAGFDPLR
ncbi:FAD-binding oxidoreductase [Prescottella sp. R16]|uniref:NAD(P)/FAD-dependent oxidoreductase n=1 Tax=Prescottella sp. R16 TaxID=3064529 RepID=UPI00272EB901|nr:FAD-dependent oxidoreductase [Prescottella sp. R16]